MEKMTKVFEEGREGSGNRGHKNREEELKRKTRI